MQDRILQEAKQLWARRQGGARIYVCGDSSRMAKDIDKTLHRIAETEGGLSEESAAQYMQVLKYDHRYQRDVY